jgi:hypothetical protein
MLLPQVLELSAFSGELLGNAALTAVDALTQRQAEHRLPMAVSLALRPAYKVALRLLTRAARSRQPTARKPAKNHFSLTLPPDELLALFIVLAEGPPLPSVTLPAYAALHVKLLNFDRHITLPPRYLSGEKNPAVAMP